MQMGSKARFRYLDFSLCRSFDFDWLAVLRIRDACEFVLLTFICSAFVLGVFLAFALIGKLNEKETKTYQDARIHRQAEAYNGAEETQ